MWTFAPSTWDLTNFWRLERFVGVSDILELLCLERNVAGQKIRILNQKFISHGDNGDKFTTPVAFLLQKNMPAPKILRYTHISDVFIVAIMALVVKFYSFNDGLFVGTLLAMTMFTIRYSGSQAGVRSCGDARHFDINYKA